MARPTYTAPSPGFEPINTIQPIRRGPKTPGKRLRVRFEGDPSTPGESESINAPNTPAFVFNTPKDKKLTMTKKDEFQMNVNKEKFNTWMKVLHESRWRKTSVKAGLVKFELPTKLINNLYEKRAEDREPWRALISSHSHNGFLNRSGLVVPKVDVTKHIPRDWERESEREGKVSSESLIQQKDGKCKICRGFKWAGVILTREISEGQEVPCYSQHKSVKPYTPQELQEFGAGDHSSLFRRWCQESRWDWLFEDPPLDGLGEDGKTWAIPKDDPRLRHVTRLNEVTKFYDADRMEIYEGLKLKLSEQDLAAKRFIDAIAKSGNFEVANKLKQMDMERKRRQVEVKYLCVRQVKLTVRGQEATKTRTGKRPANDDDLQTDNYKKQRAAPVGATPKPAVRKIANPRKPFERANGNVKSKHTASIIPPTILEPLQRIPAPFDPIELKKIRLAPSMDSIYKSPETRYRERFEEEMRFRRKRENSRAYSAKEAELEAEIHVEDCRKAEFHRIEEEKLRAKEIEEEKARAKGKPEDPVNKLPGRIKQFYNPTPLPTHSWIPGVAKKTRSFRQIGQNSNPFKRGGQERVPIRGERDRGSHIDVGVSNVVKPSARKEKGVQDMGGHGDSLFSLSSHRQNKMASTQASHQKLRERFLAHQEEFKQYQKAVRIDPFWKRPEDPREILLRQENQSLQEQAQLRQEHAARVEAERESRDRRAREADAAAEGRMVERMGRETAVLTHQTGFFGGSTPVPFALPEFDPMVFPGPPAVDSVAVQAALSADLDWSAPPMTGDSDSDSWFGSGSEPEPETESDVIADPAAATAAWDTKVAALRKKRAEDQLIRQAMEDGALIAEGLGDFGCLSIIAEEEEDGSGDEGDDERGGDEGDEGDEGEAAGEDGGEN